MATTTPTVVVGYVDKSILVEVDGGEIAVGLVTVPITLTGPDAPDLGTCAVAAEVGTPEVSIDPAVDGHDCPGGVTLPAYLRSGDDRMPVGVLACCTDCQPREV